MRIALDTGAYREFMRGDLRRVQVIRAAEQIYLPLFVLVELRSGFESSPQQNENAANLQRFLNTPRVSVLCPDEGTATCYFQLWQALRAGRLAVPAHDLWIAALAMQHALVLCTSDPSFERFPRIPRC